jgi:hypothetical protein
VWRSRPSSLVPLGERYPPRVVVRTLHHMTTTKRSILELRTGHGVYCTRQMCCKVSTRTCAKSMRGPGCWNGLGCMQVLRLVRQSFYAPCTGFASIFNASPSVRQSATVRGERSHLATNPSADLPGYPCGRQSVCQSGYCPVRSSFADGLGWTGASVSATPAPTSCARSPCITLEPRVHSTRHATAILVVGYNFRYP